MARLWTCGAELQTVTAGIEFTAIGTNAPSIETTIKRSGNAAFRISNTGGQEGFRQQFTSSQGNYYLRVYLYVVAFPTSARSIFGFGITGSYKGSIRLNTDGTLNLYNEEDNAAVGSASSALSLNTWYRVEMRHDTTTLASTAVEAKLDGTTFASGTIDIAANATNVRFIQAAADATLDYVIDDIALNDTSGSFQNTWPGEGKVIYLRPNGNGDNSDWGGSDGNNTDNYALIDETPPDTADYVQDDTSGQIDDYNLDATPAALGSSDTINVVHVGVYAAVSDATSSDPDIVLRIKASAAGTVEESSNLDCNSTTFQGPAPLPANSNYQLTTYDLPGASTTAWTKADLDQAQAGVRVSVTDAHLARVAALWVVVDFTPASGHTVTVNQISETDTAQTLTRIKQRAVAQISETDIAQPVARIKSRVIAQISETDLAQAVAWAPKSRFVNQASETDTPQAITHLKNKTIGQVSESDSAQPITWKIVRLIAQITESDSSQPIAHTKQYSVSMVSETDTAQSVTWKIIRLVNQVLETELAQPLTTGETTTVAVGQVTETDSAQPITHTKVRIVLQASEADSAQSLTHAKVQIVAQVAETDLAQSLFPRKRVSITQVVEIDLSQAIAVRKIKALGQAIETDSARPVTWKIVRLINQVTEIDFAQLITVVGGATFVAHYVYVIPAENRIYLIPAEDIETIEDRTYVIPAESRIYRVPHD